MKGPSERGTASHETVDLYAPQGVDLGGGGSPQQGMTQCVQEWPGRKSCKVPS